MATTSATTTPRGDPVVAAAVDDAIAIIQYTPVPTPPWDQQLTHPKMRPSEMQQAVWEAYAFPPDRPWGLSINLSSMYMGAALSARLGRELVMNETVTTLDLGMCDLGSDGCIELVKCLKRNYVLERLSLDGNRIGPLGAVALAEYLCQDNTGYRKHQPPVSMYPLSFTNDEGPANNHTHSTAASSSLSPNRTSGSKSIGSAPVFIHPNKAMSSVPYNRLWENDGVGGVLPIGGRPSQQGARSRGFLSVGGKSSSPTSPLSPVSNKMQKVNPSDDQDEKDPFAPGNPHRSQLLAQPISRGLLPNLQQARSDGFKLPPPNYLKCPLKSLSLSCNAIGDEGCVAIMNSIRHNNTIEFINLRANNISNLGAFAALDSIADHRLLEQQFNNHCKRVQDHIKSEKSKKKKKGATNKASSDMDIFSPMGSESCLPAHLRFDVDSSDSQYQFVGAVDQMPQQAASSRLQSSLFRSLESSELPPFSTPKLLALLNLPTDANAKERQAAIRVAMVERGFSSPQEYYEEVQRTTITSGRSYFNTRWRTMKVEQRNDFIRFAFSKYWNSSPSSSTNPLLTEAARVAHLRGTTVSLCTTMHSFLRTAAKSSVPRPSLPISITPNPLSTPSPLGVSYQEEHNTPPRVVIIPSKPPVDTSKPIPLPTLLGSGGGYLYPVLRSSLSPDTPYVPLPRGHLLETPANEYVLVGHKPDATLSNSKATEDTVLTNAVAFNFIQGRLFDALSKSEEGPLNEHGPINMLAAPSPPAASRLSLETVNHHLSLAQRTKLQTDAEATAMYDYHGSNSARLKYGHQVHAHSDEIAKLNRTNPSHPAPSTDGDQPAPTQQHDDVTEEDLAIMKRVWADVQSPRQPREHTNYMPSCLKPRGAPPPVVVEKAPPTPAVVPRPPSAPKQHKGPTPPVSRGTARSATSSHIVPSTSSMDAPSVKSGLPVELHFLMTLRNPEDLSLRSHTASTSSLLSSIPVSREGGRRNIMGSAARRPETGSSSTDKRGKGAAPIKVGVSSALVLSETEAINKLTDFSRTILEWMRSPIYAIIDPLTALLRGREVPLPEAPPMVLGDGTTPPTNSLQMCSTMSLTTSVNEVSVGRGKSGREGEAPANTESVLAPLMSAANVLNEAGTTVSITSDHGSEDGRNSASGSRGAAPTGAKVGIVRNASLKGLWLQLNDDVDDIYLQKLQMVLYTRIPLPPAGLTKKIIRAAIDRRQQAGEAIPVEYADMIMATLGGASDNKGGGR